MLASTIDGAFTFGISKGWFSGYVIAPSIVVGGAEGAAYVYLIPSSGDADSTD